MPPFYRPVDLGVITKNNLLQLKRANAVVSGACEFNGKIMYIGAGTTVHVINESTDQYTSAAVPNVSAAICADERYCYVGGSSATRKISRSSDGITFSDAFTPTADIVACAAKGGGSGEVAFITSTGIYYYSTDYGDNWTTVNSGATFATMALQYASDVSQWVLSNSSSLYRSASVANLIASPATAFPGSLQRIGFYGGRIFVGTVGGQMYFSDDNGATYQLQSYPLLQGTGTSVRQFVVGDTDFHAVCSGGQIMRYDSEAGKFILLPSAASADCTAGLRTNDSLYVFTSSSSGLYYRFLLAVS